MSVALRNGWRRIWRSRNGKHFPCFHTVIETRVEVSENEQLKCTGRRVRRASVSTQFRVLPNFHECFYNVWGTLEMFSISVYKITCRKLKRGNSLLYRSVNSPFWWRIMAWTFPCFSYSYRNMAFNQSKLAFSKCYFINIWQYAYLPSFSEISGSREPKLVWGLIFTHTRGFFKGHK